MEGGSVTGWHLVAWMLRLSAAGLFAYAGYAKVLDPTTFAAELDNYRLLPAGWSGPLSLYLPWLELTCATALFVPAVRRGAWLLLAILGFGFVGFVVIAWIRGLDITCGCFGPGGARPIDLLTVTRTTAVLALGLTGFAIDRPRVERS